MHPTTCDYKKTVTKVTPTHQSKEESFATALRNLAKKAGDSEAPTGSVTSIATNSATKSSTLPPSSSIYDSQSASSIHPPPVVTIAPTQLSTNRSRDSDDRKSSTLLHTTRHLDPIPIMHHSREPPDHRFGHERLTSPSRDESRSHSSAAAAAAAASIVTNLENQSRGFQPYHHGDDMRSMFMPQFPVDPASMSSAFPYSPYMSLPYQQPLRLDDPLMMDRYRLLAMSYYPGTVLPGLYPPTMSPLLQSQLMAAQQYELLSQQSALMQSTLSPTARHFLEAQHASMLSTERSLTTKAREDERDREQNKQREREDKAREHMLSPISSGSSKSGSIMHGTPREGQGLQLHSPRRENDGKLRHVSTPKDRGSRSSTSTDYVVNRSPKQFCKLNESHNSLQRGQSRLKESSRSLPPPLTPTKTSKDDPKAKTSFYRPFETKSPPRIHRPFEVNASSGKNDVATVTHYSDQERSVMNEEILAQDRATLTAQSHALDLSCHKAPPINGVIKDNRVPVSHEVVQSHLPKKDQELSLDLSYYKYDKSLEIDNNKPHRNKEGQSSIAEMENLIERTTVSRKGKMTEAVVSLLDMQERVLREKRMNDGNTSDGEDAGCHSDNEMMEPEKRWHWLQVIGSGPPCDVEKSKAKLRFLQYSGLITQYRKRAIMRERYMTRRGFFGENKTVLPLVEDNVANLPDASTRLTDELNKTPDFQEKKSFLSTLCLQKVSTSRKKELDIIRQAIEFDRNKTKGNTLSKESKLNHTVDGTTEGSRNKRKFNQILTIPHIDHGHRAVDGSPPKLKAYEQRLSANECHLAASHGSPVKPSVKTTKSNMAVVRPEVHNGAYSDWRSRQFAEEFHQSVLAATRQKPVASEGHASTSLGLVYPLNSNIPQSLANHRKTNGPRSHDLGQGHFPLPVHSKNVLHGLKREHNTEINERGMALNKTVIDNSAVMKWPGIEALMEACHYQRHVEDLSSQHVSVSNTGNGSRSHPSHDKDQPPSNLKITDLVQPGTDTDTDTKESHIDNLKNYITNMR